jgi:hypothetical protein
LIYNKKIDFWISLVPLIFWGVLSLDLIFVHHVFSIGVTRGQWICRLRMDEICKSHRIEFQAIVSSRSVATSTAKKFMFLVVMFAMGIHPDYNLHLMVDHIQIECIADNQIECEDKGCRSTFKSMVHDPAACRGGALVLLLGEN